MQPGQVRVRGCRVPVGHAGCGARNDALICRTPALVTLGVKRAGPVFLLGEGEGSQGRMFSAFALILPGCHLMSTVMV
jgi:hypothetical protein